MNHELNQSGNNREGLIEKVLGDLLGGIMQDFAHREERADRPGNALPVFEELARKNPRDPLAWYNLGDTLLALGRAKEAEEALRRALKLAPYADLIHYDLAMALEQQGRHDEAIKHNRFVLGKKPDFARAHSNLMLNALVNLSLCMHRMGFHEQATGELAKALPLVAGIFHNLGAFHAKGKKWPQARKYYAMAAEIESGAAGNHWGLADCCANLGDRNAAEKSYDAACKLNPKDAGLWYDRGMNLARTRRHSVRSAARRHFLRALKCRPGFGWAMYDLACLDALDGKTRGAFRRLMQATKSGFQDAAHAAKDQDLKHLRRAPEWNGFITEAKRNGDPISNRSAGR